MTYSKEDHMRASGCSEEFAAKLEKEGRERAVRATEYAKQEGIGFPCGVADGHWVACVISDRRRIEDLYDRLPLFSKKPVCPHCGSPITQVEYRPHRYIEIQNHVAAVRRPGKMRHECGRCKFVWNTQSLEAELDV